MSESECPLQRNVRFDYVSTLNPAEAPFEVVAADSIVLRPREYLLKGLIAPGEFGVWYGPPGGGKTFEVLDVAHAVATGRSILGRKVRKGKVLYCALEGAVGFERRVVGILRERGPAPDLRVYTGELALHKGDNTVVRLIATATSVRARLIIIDTLSRSMPGADENSAIDMTEMISIIGRIIRETGAHVLVVHHTGKDDSKGSRGHSSLKAAADIEIEIAKSGPGGHVLRLTKVKDGRSDLEYPFTLREIDLGTDDDGDPITTCVVVEGEQRPSGEKAAKPSPGDREALGWLKEAVHEFGTPLPAALALPSGLSATTKDRWLEIGKKRSAKADDTVRKQIDRAVTNLTLAKQMAVHHPYFWLLK
jgi:hypothetical protein